MFFLGTQTTGAELRAKENGGPFLAGGHGEGKEELGFQLFNLWGPHFAQW